MLNVEKEYQSAIDRMRPSERVARTVSLFNWTREFTGRQIQAQNPDADKRTLQLLVALRMYSNEPQVKKLIESALSNVSD